VVTNAFVKAILFLTAGRLRAVYGTNEVSALSGVIRVLPFSGLLFAVGVFALLGFPPFASFTAEMLILSGIVQAGNLMAFTLMCTLLTVGFVATGRSIFPMLWGPSERSGPPIREPRITAIPKLGFVFILVGLGIYTPKSVSDLLQLVAQSIGGN
jgi:hydrogenase-4 component F